MPLLLNGTNINNVLFNGNQLEQVKLNGTTVWTRKATSVDVPSGTVVFESSTPGATQITIEDEGTYNVTIIGAGGGGVGWLYRWGTYPDQWRASCASGGAGGYFYQQILLTQGVYAVLVGERGEADHSIINSNTASKPAIQGNVSASSGTESSLSGPAGTWISYGGGGGSCGNAYSAGGAGGTGLTSNGNRGTSSWSTRGITRTSDNGGSYIEVTSNGGVNATGSKGHGWGGAGWSWYVDKGPRFDVGGNHGSHGYVKIVKA